MARVVAMAKPRSHEKRSMLALAVTAQIDTDGGSSLSGALPAICGAQPRSALGDDGPVLTWALGPRGFGTDSAERCCEACRSHAAGDTVEGVRNKDIFGRGGQKSSGRCNVWVWCPHPTRCWANDIHNHTFGECWLKHQRDPLRAPKYNQRGTYSEKMRTHHRTAPEAVQWMSGVLGRSGPGTPGSCFGKDCIDEFRRALEAAGIERRPKIK